MYRDFWRDIIGQIIENPNLEFSRLRIVTMQFPFIPVYVRSNLNSYSESEGNINHWICGEEEIEDLSLLESFLILRSRIGNIFISDYIEWLSQFLDDSLTYICEKENPNVIIFPEYSIPMELSKDIESKLLEFSKKRCIIAGVGSVNCDKNKFVIINNGEIRYGEKVAPSPIEKDVIKGKGPLIQPIKLYQDGSEVELNILIAMCSDYIDLKNSPGPVIEQIESELKENNLSWNDIKIIIVPAFSPKIDEVKPEFGKIQLGKSDGLRKWRIVVLSHCSFFGDSAMWFYPYEKKQIVSPKLGKNESGCIIIDIPYPAVQTIEPISSAIPKNNAAITPQVKCKMYKFKFNEDDISTQYAIPIDAEDFISMIVPRIDKGLIYASLALLLINSDEQLSKIIHSINVLKKIRNKLRPYKAQNNYLLEFIIPFLDSIHSKDSYNWLLDVLYDWVDDGELKASILAIKSYISDEQLPSLPYTFGMSKRMSVTNDGE